jgi:SAM-dependent methyltransferase
MSQQPTPHAILNLAFGYWGSKTLLSAVELGLFTLLAKGPLPCEDIRLRLGLHERSVRDFLDALVALGFLDRRDGAYANAPDAEVFLDRAKPSYVGGILEMANARLYPFWGSLTEALRTGRPQNEAKSGGDHYKAIFADPERLKGFAAAMTGISAGASHAIARKFPWQKHRTFVDVGCAQGGLPVIVAGAHPHLTGVGADLPPLRPVFEEFVAKAGLDKRLAFHGLDLHKDPIPKADVVVLGHMLHAWNLDMKRLCLRKAYEALPPGGAVIVFESLIDDERRQNAFGLLMGLNMLIETPDGFEYTGAECQRWMREAGFRETRVEHLVGPDAMVVGVK